jgi:hypothetical protein
VTNVVATLPDGQPLNGELEVLSQILAVGNPSSHWISTYFVRSG